MSHRVARRASAALSDFIPGTAPLRVRTGTAGLFAAINTAVMQGASLAAALILVTSMVVQNSGAARADDAGTTSRVPVEGKRVGEDGSVTIETTVEATRTPKPPTKLVPFPEDEPPATSKTAQSQPGQSQPGTADQADLKALKPADKPSNFRPRFKTPTIRQAQHTEPATPETATNDEPKSEAPAELPGPELSTPQAETAPAAQAKRTHDSPGRAKVDEAVVKARNCKNDADCTAVIDLCRQGIKAGLTKEYEAYARRLMGWSYNRRGELRAEAGQDKEALSDFEAAVKMNAGWRAIHNRGVSYAMAGQIREALADFDRAIELNSRYPNTYFNRGELRYDQGDFAGAVKDYTAALKAGPPDGATYNSRGHAFYRLKRYGDALRDYGESIKLEPENAAALINRGDTYSDLGQYGEAAKDYRAAVRVDAKCGRAYQSAAWLMATCPDEHYRNDKLAIDAAKRAIELEGADYRNLSTLAAAQASAGMFAEAKQTQERAIKAAPSGDKVVAERMMGLYQRDLAYRDPPSKLIDQGFDSGVRQASATESIKTPPGAQQAPPQNAPPQNMPPRTRRQQPRRL